MQKFQVNESFNDGLSLYKSLRNLRSITNLYISHPSLKNIRLGKETLKDVGIFSIKYNLSISCG